MKYGRNISTVLWVCAIHLQFRPGETTTYKTWDYDRNSKTLQSENVNKTRVIHEERRKQRAGVCFSRIAGLLWRDIPYVTQTHTMGNKSIRCKT